MLAWAGMRAIPLVLLLPAFGFTQQVPANSSASASSRETLFINCQEKEKSKQVVSPVWLSEDEKWRAYVEVDVQSELELHFAWSSAVPLNNPRRTRESRPPVIAGAALALKEVVLPRTRHHYSDVPGRNHTLIQPERFHIVGSINDRTDWRQPAARSTSRRWTSCGFAMGRSPITGEWRISSPWRSSLASAPKFNSRISLVRAVFLAA